MLITCQSLFITAVKEFQPGNQDRNQSNVFVRCDEWMNVQAIFGKENVQDLFFSKAVASYVQRQSVEKK